MTSPFQTVKLAIVGTTHLSQDALHVHVGLGIFFAICLLLRQSPASPWPLLAVVAAAIAGEVLDMRDDLAILGYWRWKASAQDVFNTVFWPSVLFALTRWWWPSRRG